ncbi:MAG: glycosyltransferase [Cyanobacteriota bacterium]
MKILYFTFIENPFAPENAGVMRGQVINVLKEIACSDESIDLHWLALINTKLYKPSETEINNLKQELKEQKVNLTIESIPNGTTARKLFAVIRLLNKVKELNPDIVHCRVYPSTLIALEARKMYKLKYKVIFDARGVYPEQILERSPNFIGKVRFNYWKYLEKKLLKQSDLIIGVTNAFIDHFKKINRNANYKFIPCCVQIDDNYAYNHNNEIKTRIGFNDKDIIVVYSGNLSAKYSSINQIVEIFSNLKELNPDIKYLVLTKSDTKELKILLDSKNLLQNTKIFDLKPSEVQEYLSISNIGILYREKSIVNEVAMPTKFAEYLLGGLPVLISRSIKGVAEIVEQNNLGIVLDEVRISQEELSMLLNIDRHKCIKFARNFSTKVIAQTYIDEYKNLFVNQAK